MIIRGLASRDGSRIGRDFRFVAPAALIGDEYAAAVAYASTGTAWDVNTSEFAGREILSRLPVHDRIGFLDGDGLTSALAT